MIALRGVSTGAIGARVRGDSIILTVGVVIAPTACRAGCAANADDIRTEETQANLESLLGGAGMPVVAHVGEFAMLVTIGPFGNRQRAAKMEILFTGVAEWPLAGRAVIFDHSRRRHERRRRW